MKKKISMILSVAIFCLFIISSVTILIIGDIGRVDYGLLLLLVIVLDLNEFANVKLIKSQEELTQKTQRLVDLYKYQNEILKAEVKRLKGGVE